MIRVLIADDHPVVREGLKRIITEQPELAVHGEATTCRETIRLLTEEKFDIVLLDLSMPDDEGFEVLRELRQRGIDTPVLVVSVQEEDHVGVRVLQAGAKGFVHKGAGPETMIRAIRKVAGGGKYIGPRLAERLADHVYAEGGAHPHDRLTDREYQVMLQIAKGVRLAAIARKLSISPSTVSTHRTRILDKLHLESNQAITQYVLEHHLMDSL